VLIVFAYSVTDSAPFEPNILSRVTGCDSKRAIFFASVRNLGKQLIVKIIATSGYATWFTAGVAIREPQNP